MGISIKSPLVVVLLAIFINLATIQPIAHGKSLTHSPLVIDFKDTADQNRGDPKDFPYIAFIEYRNQPGRERCLGAIIHENWVLTTAGCSRVWLDPEEYTIIVGLGLKQKENGTRYAVENIITQPNIPDELIYNHFNLFKTEKSIRMNQLVQPIAFSRKVISNAKRGTIARWQLVGAPNCLIANIF